jgi:hypothetical protein
MHGLLWGGAEGQAGCKAPMAGERIVLRAPVNPHRRIRQQQWLLRRCQVAQGLAKPIQHLAPSGRSFVASLLRKVIAV